MGEYPEDRSGHTGDCFKPIKKVSLYRLDATEREFTDTKQILTERKGVHTVLLFLTVKQKVNKSKN